VSRTPEAGKNTLVVRRGMPWAKRYHASLLFASDGALGGFTPWFCIPENGEGWGGLLILNAVHHCTRLSGDATFQNPAQLDPELKRVALSTAVAALFFLLMAQTGMARVMRKAGIRWMCVGCVLK